MRTPAPCQPSALYNTSALPHPAIVMYSPPKPVEKPKNKAAKVLGIIALVLAVPGLLSAFIPPTAILTYPFLFTAVLLAVIGLILPLVKKERGAGLPLFALILSLVFIATPIVVSLTHQAARERERIALKEEQDLYINYYVRVYDADVRYFNSALDGRVPGATFKIQNTGDRSLSRIELVIYFKGPTGQVIFEDSYVPVSNSTLRNDRPLRPGYIWEIERGKFFAAKSAPSEWEEGSYEIKVSSISFAED